MKKSFSHNILNMKKYFLLFSIFFLLLIACDSSNKPSLCFSVSPSYPCLGEEVTFRYDCYNTNRIEVIDNNGNVLLPASSGNNGEIVIEGLTESMLPLKVTGGRGNGRITKTVGPRNNDDIILKIIDDEIQTANYELRRKTSAMRVEKTGLKECYSWTYSGSDSTCEQWYPVVAVYETVKEKYDIIYHSDFSLRARVMKIHNKTKYDLKIKKDTSTFTVQSMGTKDISNHHITPGGGWTAEFVEPLTDFNGYYWAVPTPIRTNLEVIDSEVIIDRKIEIAFTLNCNNYQN